MRAIAIAFVIAACSAPTPGAPDAHVDAVIHLPDAREPGNPCVGPIALADLGGCLARAWCTRAESCGFGRAEDTDCSAMPLALTGGLNLRDLSDGLQYALFAGSISYDADAAQTCLATVAATPCKALSPGFLSIDGCAALVGNLGPFDGCGYPFQCTADAACVYQNGNFFTPSCGLDICKSMVEQGSDCTQSPCRPGDHCEYIQPTYVCEHGDEGAPCNYDSDCDPELRCDYPGTTHVDGAGTCSSGGAVGAACASDQQCAGTLVCVGESAGAGVCTDVSVAGAACDQTCIGALVCANGACADAPALGAPCADGGACGMFMRCDAGSQTCVMRGHRGDACAPTECDLELVCTADIAGTASGTCVAPLPLETGCTLDGQCASGACVDHLCSQVVPCVPNQL